MGSESVQTLPKLLDALRPPEAEADAKNAQANAILKQTLEELKEPIDEECRRFRPLHEAMTRILEPPESRDSAQEKGPTFAYRMISAGEKVNFLNIVQGLIDINEEKLNFAASNINQKEEEFLTAKADEDGELSEFIYNDWMLPLTKNAHPLFDCDNNIWSKSDTGQLSFLSYPQTSAPIKTAAEKMHLGGWDLKESALTDRIFVMSSACGIPLSAYNKCPEYEQMLFSARTPGRHYYEGNPVSGQDFNNYYKIPVYQAYLSFQALDSERRSDIRREYQKVADTGGERLQESGKRMKAEISLTKLKGWNKQAESDTYHDKYDEIYSFLEKFQKSFQTFCELYDIG